MEGELWLKLKFMLINKQLLTELIKLQKEEVVKLYVKLAK